MKPLTSIGCAAALSVLAGAAALIGQTTTPPPPPPAGAAQTTAPAGGRGAPRPPLTEADIAEIATLERFPAWTPAAGDGNYLHRTRVRAGA